MDLFDGWVDEAVHEEHPDLRLRCLDVAARRGRSSDAVKDRLRELAGRVHGARAVTMRRELVPQAYRVFFRHIGLDPDTVRTPIEDAIMQRIVEGGFRATDLIDDALLLALVETGVPVFGYDAEACAGLLGVRETVGHERLGSSPDARDLPDGHIVVADHRGIASVLFGEHAAERIPTRQTQRVRIYAVQVAGVPSLHVEEALWTCAEAMDVS